jgi:hypothetical protein
MFLFSPLLSTLFYYAKFPPCETLLVRHLEMLFMYELQAPMTAWQKIGKPEPGIQSHKYGKCLALELFSLNLSAMVVVGGGCFFHLSYSTACPDSFSTQLRTTEGKMD